MRWVRDHRYALAWVFCWLVVIGVSVPLGGLK